MSYCIAQAGVRILAGSAMATPTPVCLATGTHALHGPLAMRPFAGLVWPIALLSRATHCAAGADCDLLDPEERFTFTERAADGTWMGSIKLLNWQEGATVSFTFNTNTEVQTLEYSTFIRTSPRTTELELLGRAPNNIPVWRARAGAGSPRSKIAGLR